MTDVAIPSAVYRLPGLGPLFAGQVRYQLLLMARTPRALFAGLLLPLLLLVVRSSALKNNPQTEAGLVAGITVLGVISTAYMTHASGLVTAREAGVLRRWRATPLPDWCFFAGRIVATLLAAITSGAVAAGAAVALYGVRLHAGAALSLLVAVMLGALVWAAIGTAATAVIPTTDSAYPLLAVTYFPVVLLSGVFGSTGGQPHWLATLMSYLPAQPIVDAGTRALQHTGGGLALIPGRDLAVLAVWAAASLLVSRCFFRWDPTRPGHAR